MQEDAREVPITMYVDATFFGGAPRHVAGAHFPISQNHAASNGREPEDPCPQIGSLVLASDLSSSHRISHPRIGSLIRASDLSSSHRIPRPRIGSLILIHCWETADPT